MRRILCKTRRLLLGLPIRDVAFLGGLTHSEVSLIENERLVPNRRQLEGLARALRVTPPEALLREVVVETEIDLTNESVAS